MATVDITNCDRELIHIPGAILPQGAMLVLDPDTFVVLQAAGDTATLLGVALDDVLGSDAGSLWRPHQIEQLRGLIGSLSLTQPRHLLDPILRVRRDWPLDASVHRNAAGLIIEFEAADGLDTFATDPLAAVQDMLSGLKEAPSLQEFSQTAAESVRRVLGYDRVMIYRFMPDDTGWVFAESCADGMVPFLDLHYPASDIPMQARALYVKSWLRVIPEIDYTPAAVRPALSPRTGQPLDMSQATLRDVSPIHREYLRNMGVNASMSVSIIRDGKLWGLVACHHNKPHRLPRHLRAVGELFGAMFSLQIETRERAEQFEARLANRAALQTLMRNLSVGDDYTAALIREAPLLLSYIRGGGLSLRGDLRGGVVVQFSSEISSSGMTPNDNQIAALAEWLASQMDGGDGVFVTDRLGELWPPAVEFADVGSGLLAISVSREPRDFILWFRPEQIETVTWAGDPSKPVEAGPNGDRLTPRKSFAAWQQMVRGRSSPWTSPDSDAAFDLRLSLLEVVLRRIDAVVQERARIFERDKLVMAELDHRVKNTLANIRALVTQTSRSAASLTDFVNNLDGRMQSMAKVHSLLTQGNWEGVALAALIGDELDPYGRGGAEITLKGPSIVLSPKASLALSLAIHELATNAAKYGSLSCAGGCVTVTWETDSDDALHVTWREAGGPPVATPLRRGFGTKLIERALAMETGGRSSVLFDPAGIICDIAMPSSAIVKIGVAGDLRCTIADSLPEIMAAPVAPRILVVEDSTLLIMTLDDMFEQLGWNMIGPASSVAEALPTARSEQIDAALLDINLDGEMSWEIAAVLKKRKIPFAFVTGYATTVLPAEFSGTAIIGKPYRIDDIERQVAALIVPMVA